jgi:Zinc carboxypeptidase
MTLRSWLPRLGTTAALVTAASVLIVDQPAATDQGAAAPEAVDGATAVGKLDPEDPGPFPDSVVPEDDTWVVAGERDGTSEFPVLEYPQVQPVDPGVMDFEHFHTGIEINWWLKKWAYEHPDIVTLYNVGESFSGEPIYQLTLTDKSTGSDTDKPAAFFEGNRHSGEITSAESALWLAWYVIENRDRAGIGELLASRAIYVRPVNNPDGHNLYLYTAQANRSSVRPHDTDVDGKLDEDSMEDLNDDGFVAGMREYVGDGNGDYAIDARDPAGHAMRYVGEGNGDYLLHDEEGIDNDSDGEINEDGIGGLDLHRNYPTNWRVEESADATGRSWTQRGAGAYPLSEPETRHVFTWLMSHTNISVVNSMDTRVPMHLRGPSTCEQNECMFKADAAIYERYDRKGVSFTGYRYAGNVYRDYATRGGGEPEPLFGHGPDFGYFGYGSIWYGDELWNNGEFTDYNDDGDFEEWELSRWCAEHGRDDCFLPWETVDHPDLGEVEVGGVNPKFWAQNPQPDLLESWAQNQAEFNLWMTEQAPKVEIVSASARPVQGGDDATHEIRVRVRNNGTLPTALEMAKQIKIVSPDTIDVEGAEVVSEPPEYFLDGGSSRVVRIRVQQQNGSEVTVTSLSTRGGVDSTTVTLG